MRVCACVSVWVLDSAEPGRLSPCCADIVLEGWFWRSPPWTHSYTLHPSSAWYLPFGPHAGSQPKTQNNSWVSRLCLVRTFIKKQNTFWDVLIWKRSLKSETKAVNLEYFFPPIFLSFPNEFKEFETDDVTILTTAAGVTLPTYTLKKIAFSPRSRLNQKIKLLHLDPRLNRLR